MSVEAVVTGRTDVSPEVAWDVITAIAAYPDRVGSYVSVEPLTAVPLRLGSSWRQTRTVFGRSHSQVLEVSEWDPPRAMTTTASESGARYVMRHRLERDGDGTLIEVRFGAEPTNLLAALVQRLMGRRLIASTREAMQRDLADLLRAMDPIAPGTAM